MLSSPPIVSVDEVRPRLRGLLHLGAFACAIPASVLLIHRSDRAGLRAIAAVYCGSLLLMLGTSAAYHRVNLTSRARVWLRRLDHSMIFLLIAGTYTPLCLAAMPLPWGIPVLAAVGAGAAVGIATKLVAFDGVGQRAGWLYLALGWVSIIAVPALVQVLTPAQLVLFGLGGAAYTIGVPVLARRRPDPWPRTFGYHEVWHLCTIVAVVLHFAGVATLVT